MAEVDLHKERATQRELEGYLSGRLGIEEAWPLDGSTPYRLVALSSVISEGRWLQTSQRTYNAIWWSRLFELIDYATTELVRAYADWAPRVAPVKAEALERLVLNLSRTGGCLPFALLPEAVLSRGEAYISRSFFSGAFLALGLTPCSALYPVVQFTGSGAVVPRLRAIEGAFGSSKISMFNFLLDTNLNLGRRAPIDWMKEGSFLTVLDLAKTKASMVANDEISS